MTYSIKIKETRQNHSFLNPKKESKFMKTLVINISLLFVFTSLYCFQLLSASIYSQIFIGGTNWNDDLGLFGTALKEVSIIPNSILLILIFISLIFLLNQIIDFKKYYQQKVK